jgi:hypothetical protein
VWNLKGLYKHCHECQTEVNGKWVPARPLLGSFRWRLSDAWNVLIGKADAFKWPEGQ